MIDLNNWSTEDLFYYCIELGIIYKMDDYDNWKEEKQSMILKITNKLTNYEYPKK